MSTENAELNVNGGKGECSTNIRKWLLYVYIGNTTHNILRILSTFNKKNM